jgi:hypothetical protein
MSILSARCMRSAVVDLLWEESAIMFPQRVFVSLNVGGVYA